MELKKPKHSRLRLRGFLKKGSRKPRELDAIRIDLARVGPGGISASVPPECGELYEPNPVGDLLSTTGTAVALMVAPSSVASTIVRCAWSIESEGGRGSDEKYRWRCTPQGAHLLAAGGWMLRRSAAVFSDR